LKKLKKYGHLSKKWKQLTDSITFFPAKVILPVYTVDKKGFQKLSRAFDLQYQLPSRKYFSNTAIPALYAST